MDGFWPNSQRLKGYGATLKFNVYVCVCVNIFMKHSCVCMCIYSSIIVHSPKWFHYKVSPN